MTRILVTGASGFVGAALAGALLRDGFRVRAAARRQIVSDGSFEAVRVEGLSGKMDWRAALQGVHAVIHLAGPAHASLSREQLFEPIIGGARALAAQALEAGVSRLIFLSSIKAVGEQSTGAAFDEATPARPLTFYGVAKRKAEKIFLEHPALAPVVLRPPLVVSAEARANFGALVRLAASPWPLPLGGLSNRRSLIALDALVAALIETLRAPLATTGVFHLASRPALSTPEIVTHLRAGMGKAPGLFNVHASLCRFAPEALTESLEVNDTAFRSAVGYGANELDAREALRQIGRAWAAR